jgi:iron-sulfur cluster repair protein YtfE (RIC family)
MPKKIFVERDRHGRDRFVVEKRGSSSRSSTAELLEAAEQREAILIAENGGLRTRLSVAERDSWEFRNLTAEYQHLVNEHHQCRYLRAQLEAQVRETRRVEDKLDDEKDRVDKLTEMLNRMKSYKEKYEEKWKEVEILKRRILERDDMIRLAETRIEDKNKVIIYLKSYLRRHGFHVD